MSQAAPKSALFTASIIMRGSGLLTLLTGTLLVGSAMAGHSHNHTHKHPHVPHQLDPEAITHAIEAISKSTQTLGDTVVGRPMNIVKALTMQAYCDGVSEKIRKGIKIAQKSEPLNMSLSLGVLVATEDLVTVVNNTMTAVIEAHDVFANLSVVPLLPIRYIPHMDVIVLKDLKKQSKLSKEFGENVLLKVPPAGREDGQDRLDKIAESFAQAIAVYQRGVDLIAEETAFEDDLVNEKTAVPFTG
ncbi:hypothetical protein N0V93_007016 [Gnomoniopsis smithogilvyi]|uniref:Uncharacterized protein n=1 Tax=Gnomoniopsis smithogilvyi TaxID=1191159 RepID=A0A9W8YRV5_9PEZI|nr:hypothetical protein N0V93_007016 [Gnomoniopsis smithogilvyi]